MSSDVCELDQVEAKIEQAEQEFKRQVWDQALEAADRRIAEVAQTVNHRFTSTARVPSPSLQDTITCHRRNKTRPFNANDCLIRKQERV
ncbi:MAG: hypothetical protein FWD31_10795 [Planctomycetaceae bacterium]|nr:hypothetical protein [Planctomycetaceae bacterium]